MNFLLIKIVIVSTNRQKQPCNWKQCVYSPHHMLTGLTEHLQNIDACLVIIGLCNSILLD